LAKHARFQLVIEKTRLRIWSLDQLLTCQEDCGNFHITKWLGLINCIDNQFEISSMKSNPIKIFLMIAISLYILVSSTYGQYYTVASADFISLRLKLENFDHEYLSAADQSELKMSGSGGPFIESQLATCQIGLPFYLFSPISSFNQKTSILRC